MKGEYLQEGKMSEEWRGKIEERLQKIEKELAECEDSWLAEQLDSICKRLDVLERLHINLGDRTKTRHELSVNIPATIYKIGQKFEKAGDDHIYQLIYNFGKFSLLNTNTSTVNGVEEYKTYDADAITCSAFEDTFGTEYEPVG